MRATSVEEFNKERCCKRNASGTVKAGQYSFLLLLYSKFAEVVLKALQERLNELCASPSRMDDGHKAVATLHEKSGPTLMCGARMASLGHTFLRKYL